MRLSELPLLVVRTVPLWWLLGQPQSRDRPVRQSEPGRSATNGMELLGQDVRAGKLVQRRDMLSGTLLPEFYKI